MSLYEALKAAGSAGRADRQHASHAGNADRAGGQKGKGSVGCVYTHKGLSADKKVALKAGKGALQRLWGCR